MTDIRFYHMERQSLDQVLPMLLNKALSAGHKIIVQTPDEQEAERLNAHLWTYHPGSFLPHGTQKDGHAEEQPVFLTSANENPNGADVLILTGGATNDAYGEFALCCEMLDGRQSDIVQAARARWKDYKDAGHDVTYWQQSQNGWEQKA